MRAALQIVVRVVTAVSHVLLQVAGRVGGRIRCSRRLRRSLLQCMCMCACMRMRVSGSRFRRVFDNDGQSGWTSPRPIPAGQLAGRAGSEGHPGHEREEGRATARNGLMTYEADGSGNCRGIPAPVTGADRTRTARRGGRRRGEGTVAKGKQRAVKDEHEEKSARRRQGADVRVGSGIQGPQLKVKFRPQNSTLAHTASIYCV